VRLGAAAWVVAAVLVVVLVVSSAMFLLLTFGVRLLPAPDRTEGTEQN